MTSSPTSVEPHLPVKPAIFHILLALAETERHGYAIMQDVRSRSDGRIRLETGPLYRHLKRLLDDGLVAESHRRPTGGREDQRRRYYRLTALGRRVLRAEGERMAALVEQTERIGVVSAAKGGAV